MWGRAGRRGRGLAVYVAGEDALDQFFCRHPDEFLDRPVEAAILDPVQRADPRRPPAVRRPRGAAGRRRRGVLRRRLARRRPSSSSPPASCASARAAATSCAGPRTSRRPRSRCARPAATASRSSTTGSGELLGTVDGARAFTTTHEGAVYLHGGRSFEVTALDLEHRRALVRPFAGDWYTQPKRETDTSIERLLDRRETLGVTLSFGTVIVTDQVLAYQRKRLSDHESIDLVALDLPATSFVTQALWYELDDDAARRRCRSTPCSARCTPAEHCADRRAAAAGDVRPLGHRRALDQPAPADRRARRSSSTTATRAGSGSPAAATSPSRRWSTTPTAWSASARARRAARRACSRRSAATSTSRCSKAGAIELMGRMLAAGG